MISQAVAGSVAALAGRRIDAADAEVARFPLAVIPVVRRLLRNVFDRERPRLLVCSAACGADLIGLDIARSMGIEAHIILPYAAQRFRETSVVDRPGDWGPLYDSLVIWADLAGRLEVLRNAGDGDAAFSVVTAKIVSSAAELAKDGIAIAITVSENRPRDTHDATEEFRKLAEIAGMRVVPTIIP